MKTILKATLLILFISTNTYAQLKSAEVGVDGLTCSMCSYSVENSIRQLNSISNVKMDLNKNIATVDYNLNSNPDIGELAKKVKNSGFSVRYIKVKLPEEVEISPAGHFTYQKKDYIIVNYKKGFGKDSIISFIGKEFMQKSDFKSQFARLTKEQKKAYNSKNTYLVKIEK